MRKNAVVPLLLPLALFLCTKTAVAASNLEEGVNHLAAQIGKSMQEKQKQKIAVIDFSDLNGNVTALGQFIAEELTTQLFTIAPGKFEVVERRQLLKLQEELALGQTGLMEEKSIKKLGRMLGVDAVVTGSMTDLGNTVKINARLIGVESAKVFAVAATEIPKTGTVADLIANQAQKNQATTKFLTPYAPLPPEERTEETKEVLFQLQRVKMSGKTLISTLAVTNKGKDRQLCVKLRRDDKTRIVDDQGNEYAVTSARVGNKSVGSQVVCNDVVSGVPTGLTLKFEGVSSEPKSIALLQIDCNFFIGWDFIDDFTVQFRNVSVTK